MKKKIVAVLLAALACACVWFAVHATKNIAYAWLCAVICAIGAAVQWRSGCGKNKKNAIMKQQKSQMAPQPTPQPEKPQYAFVRFKVAGTTFDSDGVSRQAPNYTGLKSK